MLNRAAIFFSLLAVVLWFTTESLEAATAECEACIDAFHSTVSDCGVTFKSDMIKCKAEVDKATRKPCKKTAQKAQTACMADAKATKKSCLTTNSCNKSSNNNGQIDSNGCTIGSTCWHPQMNHCMAKSLCDLPQYAGQCLCTN